MLGSERRLRLDGQAHAEIPKKRGWQTPGRPTSSSWRLINEDGLREQQLLGGRNGGGGVLPRLTQRGVGQDGSWEMQGDAGGKQLPGLGTGVGNWANQRSGKTPTGESRSRQGAAQQPLLLLVSSVQLCMQLCFLLFSPLQCLEGDRTHSLPSAKLSRFCLIPSSSAPPIPGFFFRLMKKT